MRRWHYSISLHLSNDLKKYDIINQVKNDTNVCDYKSYSTFFNNICEQIEQKKWVDIENEYYNALNKEYFFNPQKLNNEFEIVKLKLIEYLTNIQETEINEAIINQSLKNKIFAPIKTRDVAISAREHLLKFAAEQYAGIKGFSYATIYHQLEDIDGREKHIQDLENFAEEYGKQIELLDIESVINENIIPDSLLYPNRLMLLNFNYTHTADLYIPQGKTKEYWFPINHIHGNLKEPTSIIFGYGDELDDKYSKLVKLNNNDFLHNAKSIKYIETDNYRKMLAFINSAPYQIYIMGHSYGNSDRTLLNTLFEHKNCLSIKPFYYAREDGSDNYLEIIQNISRNFTDMKLMRDRVVNKTYCEKLLD